MKSSIYFSKITKGLGLAIANFYLFQPALGSDTEYLFNDANQVKHVGLRYSPSLAEFKNNLYCAHHGGSTAGISGELYVIKSSDGDKWDGGKRIQEQKISFAPGLGVHNGKLYCAYMPVNTKELWYTASTDGDSWSQGKKIEGVGTHGSASLASFNNKLYLAYTGGGNPYAVYTAATSNESNWEHTKVYDHNGTSPSIAVFNNKLYCSWVEGRNSFGLGFVSSEDGKNWSSPKVIPNISGISSSINTFNSRLYFVFKPIDIHSQFHYVTTTDSKNWGAKTKIPEPYGTVVDNDSAALTAFDGGFYCGYTDLNKGLWINRIYLEPTLGVTLKDFDFGTASELQRIFDANKKLAFASTQTLSVDENTVGSEIGGTYGEELDESFSWGLNEKVGVGTKTEVKSGIPFLAEAKVEVSGSFEFGSSQDWSTNRKKSFQVNIKTTPNSPGKYKLGTMVYSVEDAQLPFKAKAKLTAKKGDTKLDVTAIESLFNKQGLTARIVERNHNDKYLMADISGTLRANYGVTQDTIAQKISD